MSIRKASRSQSKVRVGICGASGSGKTYSSLLMAEGISGDLGKVVLIDTENGSGDLYSNLGEYSVLPITAPFTAEKYINAIHECEKAGFDTIIIDSLSHCWAGQGGLLEQVDNNAQSNRGNSYTAWRSVTPLHNKLIDAMLQSPANIIATMRSKVEYVLETNSNGKQQPKKIGMAPVQREGMDYEFTIVFDVANDSHIASVSKDRTSLFDGQSFKITNKIGESIREWLNNAMPATIEYISADQVIKIRDALKELKSDEIKFCNYLGAASLELMPAHLYERAKEAIKTKKETSK